MCFSCSLASIFGVLFCQFESDQVSQYPRVKGVWPICEIMFEIMVNFFKKFSHIKNKLVFTMISVTNSFWTLVFNTTHEIPHPVLSILYVKKINDPFKALPPQWSSVNVPRSCKSSQYMCSKTFNLWLSWCGSCSQWVVSQGPGSKSLEVCLLLVLFGNLWLCDIRSHPLRYVAVLPHIILSWVELFLATESQHFPMVQTSKWGPFLFFTPLWMMSKP